MQTTGNRVTLYSQAVKWALGRDEQDAAPNLSADRMLERDPSLLEWLRKSQIIACIPQLSCPADRSVFDLMWQHQRAELVAIFSVLQRLKIESMLIKGAAMIEQHFHSRGMLLLRDCDILVDKSKLALAKTSLQLLGFTQASYKVESQEIVPFSAEDIRLIENSHYQTLPFLKRVNVDALPAEQLAQVRQFKSHTRAPNVVLGQDGSLALIVEIDLHFGIAPDVQSDGMLFNPRKVSGDGFTFPALEDHLWFLCARYYNELAMHQKRSLRDTIYIARLLAHIDAIDFGYLADVVTREEQHCALFYILSTIRHFGDISSSKLDHFLAQMSPIGKRRFHDWGWLLGRFFDEIDEPFFAKPRPAVAPG